MEAVAFSPSHPHALTGSLSGALAIWDIPTQTLRHRCNHEVGGALVCTGYKISAGTAELVAGGCSSFSWPPLQGGVVKLHCSSSQPVVYSAALDGSVRLWDLRSGQCARRWQGHADDILDISVSRFVYYSIRQVKFNTVIVLLNLSRKTDAEIAQLGER